MRRGDWVVRCLTALPWVLAAVIVGALAREIARDAINVPSWDQWHIAPAIADAREGRFGTIHPWRQYNEHRCPIPRLLIVGLALMSDWDVRWEIAATFVLGVSTLLLLLALVRRTVAPLSHVAAGWAALAVTGSLCTMRAWQHWLWGWQVHAACNVVAVVMLAWLLARWRATVWRTVGLVAAGTAAGFSFASGMLTLWLVPLALLLHSAGTARERRAHAAGAAVAAAALTAIYLVGYTKPAHHPSLNSAVDAPGAALAYVLAYLGNVLTNGSIPLAVAWGGIGLGAVGAAVAVLWWREPGLRAALLPWAFLTSYAGATAVMTAVGRVGGGVGQALVPRYAIFSGLFWAGTAPILALVCAGAAAGRPLSSRGRRGVGVAAAALGGLIVTSWAMGWHAGTVTARNNNRTLHKLRPCILHSDEAPDACVRQLYPSAEYLRRVSTRLATHRLGPFATWQPEPPLSSYEQSADAKQVGEVESFVVRDGGDVIEVRGWMAESDRPILVSVGDEVLGRASRARRRKDLGVAPGAIDRTGFWLRIRAFRVTSQTEPVRAWLVLDDGRIAPAVGALTVSKQALEAATAAQAGI